MLERNTMPKLFDITTRTLEAAIKGTVIRNRVVANNISNADTPAFQAADFPFEKQLKVALERSKTNGSSGTSNILTVGYQEASLEKGPVSVENHRLLIEANDQPRLDGNTVDIDREMVKLAQNSILHNSFINLLNTKFRMLKTAMGNTR